MMTLKELGNTIKKDISKLEVVKVLRIYPLADHLDIEVKYNGEKVFIPDRVREKIDKVVREGCFNKIPEILQECSEDKTNQEISEWMKESVYGGE